jgi:hypothetical protein
MPDSFEIQLKGNIKLLYILCLKIYRSYNIVTTDDR